MRTRNRVAMWTRSRNRRRRGRPAGAAGPRSGEPGRARSLVGISAGRPTLFTSPGRSVGPGGRAFLAGEPHVPEERPVPVRIAGDRLLLDPEREEVAELHDGDLVPEPALDLLPDHLAPGNVRLAPEPRLERVELRIARPPRPVAGEDGELRGVGLEADAGREHLVELRVVPPLDDGRPFEDLEVDVEPHVLELLLGGERRLVHPVVELGGHPAERFALVARLPHA